jgi:hypothetical protein
MRLHVQLSKNALPRHIYVFDLAASTSPLDEATTIDVSSIRFRLQCVVGLSKEYDKGKTKVLISNLNSLKF